MSRNVAVFGLALAAVMVGAHAALAQSTPNNGNLVCDLLPFLCPPPQPWRRPIPPRPRCWPPASRRSPRSAAVCW